MARWAGLADAMDSGREVLIETMDASGCGGVVMSSMRFLRIDFVGFEEEAMAEKHRNSCVVLQGATFGN